MCFILVLSLNGSLCCVFNFLCTFQERNVVLPDLYLVFLVSGVDLPITGSSHSLLVCYINILVIIPLCDIYVSKTFTYVCALAVFNCFSNQLQSNC